MTISRKVTLACGFIAVAVVAVCGGLIHQTAVQMRTIENTGRALSVIEAVDGLRASIVSGRLAILRMVVAGRVEEAAAFNESIATMRERRDTLLANLRREPADTASIAMVQRLDELLTEWIDTVATAQIGDMTDPSTVDLARVRESAPGTQALWNEINAILKLVVDRSGEAGKTRVADLLANQALSQLVAVLAALVLVAAVLGLMLFLQQALMRPMRLLTRTTMRLRERDWSVDIPQTGARTEVGDMARALKVLRDEGRRNDETEARQREEARLQMDRAAAVRRSAETFKAQAAAVLEELEGAGLSLAETAARLSDMAGSSHSYTQSVAASAGSTGVSMQSVAASIEEMSISVNEISRQVQSASELAQQTTSASEQAVAQVSGLLQKSQKIHSVVGLINGIAGQINLLALNATIEAARAGSAGKGFAVVAQQVKELADQTSNATEEITKVIDDVSTEITQVVRAIERIGGSINAVNDSSAAVAAAVEEQSTALTEISSSVGSVSSQGASVADNVRAVEGKVAETYRLAESVGELSRTLKASSSRMSEEIEAFIGAVTETQTEDHPETRGERSHTKPLRERRSFPVAA